MDIRLPQLAEGVNSGTVVNILVAEGEKVRKDQDVLELETEKAVGAIPSPFAGVVAKIHVKPGDAVSVGQALITLAEGGAAQEPAPQVPPTAGGEAPQKPRAAASAPSPVRQPQRDVAPAAPPSVRKLAQELGIDLARVRGSERGGRITLEDLRAYVRELQEFAVTAREPEGQQAAPVQEKVDFSRWGPVSQQPLSTVRRTIGRRMLESWTTIPHITQFDEADITALEELRKKYRAAYAEKGGQLTLTCFALRAAAAALKKHPLFNASLDEASGHVVFKTYYHVGIAVDTEAGLIVPVLRDVDQKDLLEIARELETLVEKTRQRKVSWDDLQGTTFTISNQGNLGGGHFTPIINKPDAAILGLGKSALKPVVRDGKVQARLMLPLCLSYDHRLIDGADAVRFMNEIVQTLGNFPEEEIRGASLQ